MSSTSLIGATGVSGTRYEFQLYPFGTHFVKLPGVYIFTKRPPNSNWEPLYIGETHDLDNRVGSGLMQHHKVSMALSQGATHVGVIVVQGPEANRLRVESDLCQAYSPVCNGVSATVNRLLGGF